MAKNQNHSGVVRAIGKTIDVIEKAARLAAKKKKKKR